jgi:hypothetical protein
MLKSLESVVASWGTEATQIATKVKARIEKETEDFKKEEAIYCKNTVVDTSTESPIWTKFPPLWKDSREQEWSLLVQQLFEDECTFTVAPSHDLCTTVQKSSLQNNDIVIDSTYEVDMLEIAPCAQLSLQLHPRLTLSRLHLVPKKVKEPLFWSNLFWKCRELGKCSTMQQVHTLLLVINSPVVSVSTTTSSSNEEQQSDLIIQKTTLHKQKIDAILEPVFELEKNRIWTDQQWPRIEEEIRTANNCIELLTDLLVGLSNNCIPNSSRSTTTTESMDSLFHSCQYHKQKISSIVGELVSHPCSKAESIQTQLLTGINEDLNVAIKHYQQTLLLSQPPCAPLDDAPPSAVSATSCPVDAAVVIPTASICDEDSDSKLPWEIE